MQELDVALLPPGDRLTTSAKVVELDVRPFHERGEEPFAAIMAAFEGLHDDEALLLINSFEPVPLYAVMQRRGYHHQTANPSSDEWHVLFVREPAG